VKLRTVHVVLVVSLAGAAPVLGADMPKEGLRSEEVQATQVASRAFFAAQRAERRDAEQAGLVALAEEVAALRDAVREARRVEAAPHQEPAALRPTQANGAPGAAASKAASARDRADAALRRHRRVMRSRRSDLASRVANIETPRQRDIARAVLGSLDALDTELGAVLGAGPGERPERLRDLEARLRDTDESVKPSTAPDVEPNMTTIIRHRNPLRRRP
jgi:hypothetical protein